MKESAKILDAIEIHETVYTALQLTCIKDLPKSTKRIGDDPRDNDPLNPFTILKSANRCEDNLCTIHKGADYSQLDGLIPRQAHHKAIKDQLITRITPSCSQFRANLLRIGLMATVPSSEEGFLINTTRSTYLGFRCHRLIHNL